MKCGIPQKNNSNNDITIKYDLIQPHNFSSQYESYWEASFSFCLFYIVPSYSSWYFMY